MDHPPSTSAANGSGAPGLSTVPSIVPAPLDGASIQNGAPVASSDFDDDDKLSDVIPDSRDLSASVSRATSPAPAAASTSVPSSRLRNEITEDNGDEEEAEDDDSDVEMEDGQAANGDAPLTPAKARKVQEAADRRAVRAERKQQVNSIIGKREEMEKQKLADSMKRFQYLLGQTELFQHFVDIKKTRDPEFAKLLAEQEAKAAKGKKKATDTRHRKSEKEEDEELLHDGEEEDEAIVYEQSPWFVKGGKMRDYQIAGLNWMAQLHHNGINGILADEMGLGKTLQTISFLGHLKFAKNISGPHLVVVPKSTLDNWSREVAKWVPGFRTIVLQGTKEERAIMINDSILPQKFDILITSYEMCLREKSVFKKFSWEYIIIDEAHRIKNVDSLLSQIVRAFTSRGRLLITGTPLQNNLQELWALLNFILPDVFSSSEDFDEWFKKKGEDDEQRDSVVQQLHKVLRPFLLRRVKADVEHSLLPKKEINLYVGMTEMQRKWYKSLLEKDIDAVNGATGKKEGKTRLLNIVMQLRKCCNHPYLFDGAEPGPPFTTDEHLVDNAGKMIVLDKLLKAMQQQGSRVLIFSQMSRVLDILEDYCHFRGFKYCRIDGGTAHEDRVAAIDEYNKPGSEKFIFLLTTRAGGLGINLVTANIVVLFDSDWNPQADLQAMDRAHRIGQTKQVMVFRFITQDAVEERILERATQKLKLDQLVIQQGRAQQNNKAVDKDDLVGMIQHGAEKIINSKESMVVDADIDEIIRQGEEKTKELNSKYEGLDIDDLTNFKSDIGTRQFEGEDYSGVQAKRNLLWIEPAKRERKTTGYSIDRYFSEAMRTATAKPDKPKVARAPKQYQLHDYQFFPQRLHDLQAREFAAWEADQAKPKREENADEGSGETQPAPLTEDEMAEKEELYQQGFPEWNRRHFQVFIRGLSDHGRDHLEKIAPEIGKDLEEVERYAEVFWKRNREIEDIDNHLARIQEGDRQRGRKEFERQILEDKVNSVKQPMQRLTLQYGTSKGRIYTDENDRFLVVRMAHYGVHREDCFEFIKRDIGEYPAFRFDWYFKSRTPEELKRRGQTLLTCIKKEYDVPDEFNQPAKKPAAGNKKRGAAEDVRNEEIANDSRAASPSSTASRTKKRKT